MAGRQLDLICMAARGSRPPGPAGLNQGRRPSADRLYGGDRGNQMADAEPLWGLLKQAADPSVAEALTKSVETDPDRALNRINPLAYAKTHGCEEEPVIGAFVHAARLGLFDMSWN